MEKKLGRPPRKGTLTREDRDRVEAAAQTLRNAVDAWDRGMTSAMDLVRAAKRTLDQVRVPSIVEQRRLPRRSL